MTRRRPLAEPVYGTCAECGQQMRVRRAWQRFCSKRCRERVSHRKIRQDARSHRARLQQQKAPEA